MLLFCPKYVIDKNSLSIRISEAIELSLTDFDGLQDVRSLVDVHFVLNDKVENRVYREIALS